MLGMLARCAVAEYSMARIAVSHSSLTTCLQQCMVQLSPRIAASYSTDTSRPDHGPSHSSGSASLSDSESLHDPPSTDKARLLDTSLAHVHQLGWARAAVLAAAKDLGLSPAAAGMLKHGEVELVWHLMGQRNQQLAVMLANEDLNDMRMKERIERGLQLRLEMNVPYMNSWAQALGLAFRPAALPTTTKLYSDIADAIWTAAGDASTDSSWYTKRGLVMGVYTTMELYMLTDRSSGYANTWEALNRRLDDVLETGKAAGDVTAFASSMAEMASSLLQQLGKGAGPRP